MPIPTPELVVDLGLSDESLEKNLALPQMMPTMNSLQMPIIKSLQMPIIKSLHELSFVMTPLDDEPKHSTNLSQASLPEVHSLVEARRSDPMKTNVGDLRVYEGDLESEMADACPEKPGIFSSKTHESRLDKIKEKIESNKMFIDRDSA
jgi:hypothetical protein